MNKRLESLLDDLLGRFLLGPSNDYIVVYDGSGKECLYEIDNELATTVANIQNLIDSGTLDYLYDSQE